MILSRLLGSAFAFASIINAQVNLRTARPFAVLAGSTVTNTGPTVIMGDVGVSPGTAITGFPPGVITNGAIHAADAVAAQAQSDITTAYNVAARQPPTTTLPSQQLGGLTLIAGVYRLTSSAQLTGTLTLDGQGVTNGVWIFQIGSALTTASASMVLLINGALPCNVFWQVRSSATIGTGTTFAGNVLALTSITLNTGATNNGGIYARNGAVTLDSNTIRGDPCSPIVTTATTTTTTTSTTTTTTPTTTSTTTTTTTTSTPTTTTTSSTTTTSTIPTATTTATTTTTGTGTATTTITIGIGTTTTIGTGTTTTSTIIGIGTTTTTTTGIGMTTTTATGTGTTTSIATLMTTTSTKAKNKTFSTPTGFTTSAARNKAATFTTTHITITSCAPTVIEYTIGHVTTETVISLTTWYPSETEESTVIATASLGIMGKFNIPAPVCTESSCPHITQTASVEVDVAVVTAHATNAAVPVYHSCERASETPIPTPAANYPETGPVGTAQGIYTITKPCSTCGAMTQGALVVAAAAEAYRVSAAGFIAAALAMAINGM